jgi:hypothetical protein
MVPAVAYAMRNDSWRVFQGVLAIPMLTPRIERGSLTSRSLARALPRPELKVPRSLHGCRSVSLWFVFAAVA